MGMDLSIDDFGTGYSPLGVFEAQARQPAEDRQVIRAEHGARRRRRPDCPPSTWGIHGLLRVLVEGIESEAVWRLLALMGCDHGKAYFMSSAVDG
jgi:diguanylate cyclase